jgi:hypothetical protein
MNEIIIIASSTFHITFSSHCDQVFSASPPQQSQGFPRQYSTASAIPWNSPLRVVSIPVDLTNFKIHVVDSFDFDGMGAVNATLIINNITSISSIF